LVPDVLRKLGLRGAIASLVVPVLALSLGVPAAAQFQSEGYQFLEAVKDREGNKATDMLNKPGNQLINTRDITSGDTGLHLVIADGDILWTRFLLQRGADPNIKNKKGETPLQRAVALDFTEGVAALLGNKIKANVNVTDSTGATPLITAVIGRRVALVRLLLAGGADPDRQHRPLRTRSPQPDEQQHAAQAGVRCRRQEADRRGNQEELRAFLLT